jgi:hypothetical protein
MKIFPLVAPTQPLDMTKPELYQLALIARPTWDAGRRQ